MSSRNPKELKEIIEKNRIDTEYEEFDESLKKLHNLPESDKTNDAFLRMRIEEQSRLIMILKERGDEFIRKFLTVDNYNKELLDEKETHDGQLEALNNKIKLLTKRFDDLAENHQEMIKIKDEYKSANNKLVDENKRLKMQMTTYDADQLIREKDLRENIKELNEKCKQYELNIKNLDDQYKSQIKIYENEMLKNNSDANEFSKKHENELKELKNEIHQRDSKINELTLKLVNTEKDLERNEKKHKTSIDDLSKEKSELLDLTIQRAKLLTEKQTENRKLTEKILELNNVVKSFQDKLQAEIDRLDGNKQVQELRRELNIMKIRNRELELEYEAFRKHTNSLIDQEKRLNSKLKFLVS